MIDMPDELIEHMCKSMGDAELVRFVQTSKRMRAICADELSRRMEEFLDAKKEAQANQLNWKQNKMYRNSRLTQGRYLPRSNWRPGEPGAALLVFPSMDYLIFTHINIYGEYERSIEGARYYIIGLWPAVSRLYPGKSAVIFRSPYNDTDINSLIKRGKADAVTAEEAMNFIQDKLSRGMILVKPVIGFTAYEKLVGENRLKKLE
ncbi:MAG: F-box protein [Sulfobacillus sp.]